MKELFTIFVEPFQDVKLSRREKLAIGIGAPAAYVVVCILASLLP